VIFFITLESDFVVEIGTTSAHAEHLQSIRVKAQGVDDIVSDTSRCRRSKAYYGHVGEFFFEEGQLLESRAEVVAPLAHTMRLIDCNTRKLSLGIHDPKELTEVVQLAILGRHIK